MSIAQELHGSFPKEFFGCLGHLRFKIISILVIAKTVLIYMDSNLHVELYVTKKVVRIY